VLPEVSLPAVAMDTINRSAIVVRPAQPFLDWLHRVDPTSVHLTLEDLQREPTIYLVAECDSQDEAMKYLGGKRQRNLRGAAGGMVPRAGSLAREARFDHIPELV
jgi:hypothetical protein